MGRSHTIAHSANMRLHAHTISEITSKHIPNKNQNSANGAIIKPHRRKPYKCPQCSYWPIPWPKKHMIRHSTNDQFCHIIWWGPTFSQLSIYHYSWIMMHTLCSGITRFWAKWQGRCFHVLCLYIAESAILLSNPGPIIALPVCPWYAWCFWRVDL